MPNNSYLRSTRRERELVNEYRSLGWDACRSAGSHSPWDIWCWNPKTHEVLLIQVKTKKGGRSVKITNQHVYQGDVSVMTKWITYG